MSRYGYSKDYHDWLAIPIKSAIMHIGLLPTSDMTTENLNAIRQTHMNAMEACDTSESTDDDPNFTFCFNWKCSELLGAILAQRQR